MFFHDGKPREDRGGEWQRIDFGCSVGWYSTPALPGVQHERFTFEPLSNGAGETDIEKLRHVVQIDLDLAREHVKRLEDWLDDTGDVATKPGAGA